LGHIAVGAAADLALFRLDALRFAGAGDPLAALVLCGAHQADRVMVAGQWRVIDGAIPGLDLAALIARQNQSAAVLAGIS
jgi:8-oxoguanine deaminase